MSYQQGGSTGPDLNRLAFLAMVHCMAGYGIGACSLVAYDRLVADPTVQKVLAAKEVA